MYNFCGIKFENLWFYKYVKLFFGVIDDVVFIFYLKFNLILILKLLVCEAYSL